MAGWLSNSRAAARVTFRSSARTVNATSRLGSVGRLHHNIQYLFIYFGVRALQTQGLASGEAYSTAVCLWALGETSPRVANGPGVLPSRRTHPKPSRTGLSRWFPCRWVPFRNRLSHPAGTAGELRLSRSRSIPCPPYFPDLQRRPILPVRRGSGPVAYLKSCREPTESQQ
jgi:hypothetical protein